MWIATSARGLVRVGKNGKAFTYSVEKGNFSCNNIVSLAFDKDGVLWFKDAEGSFYSYTSFTGFVKHEELPSDLAAEFAGPVEVEEQVPVEPVPEPVSGRSFPSWPAFLLAFIFFVIVAFVGFRFYTSAAETEMGIDSEYEAKAKIALEDFRQASNYVELEVLTLDEAEPDKEMSNWVKDKQKGKEGIYARTFFKVEDGSINTDNGSGSYALTYAYTVVVIRSADGTAYAPTGYDVTHSEGIDNALLIDEATVLLDAGKNSGRQASEFGNVFVIKHAYGYMKPIIRSVGNSQMMTVKP